MQTGCAAVLGNMTRAFLDVSMLVVRLGKTGDKYKI